jgi:hypothetical protein
MPNGITIRPVKTKADRKAFVELPFRHYAQDPAWIPPLKDEAYGLITPGKNPFFEHAIAQLFLADKDGQVVGRISASIDHMWTRAGRQALDRPRLHVDLGGAGPAGEGPRPAADRDDGP